MKPSIQVDTKQLSETFRQYAALSRRGIAENLNQKAYSICLSAYGNTKKAKPSEIRKYLRGPSRVSTGAPLAAILINKSRRQKGLKGLRGSEMVAAVEEFIRKKSTHSNYLRVGWFQAIGVYARTIGKNIGKSMTRQVNKIDGPSTADGGGATPAKPSNNPLTTFWNTAFSKQTTTDQGAQIAGEGLAKAIQIQIADMNKYIGRKQQELSDKVFRRFMR